ncbi:iron complex transport system permease protein [Cohaesibacter sp. ES.047]|uniref:FecCD family ABC transporter permease n=1 Tax=Cohaesibacter sp. ES.047 TaxID=1798205 RepID=UPI000BB785CB|nr:iron ABC transporter permease [Cohaesibacter sp. ES.047]SNY93162.1 iron complex transport system permease protein [Cohaesibacter sp. ES.047]
MNRVFPPSEVALSGSSSSDQSATIRRAYARRTVRASLTCLVGLVLLVLLSVFAVSLGANDISLAEAFQILLGPVLPDNLIAEVSVLQEKVVLQLRLPRIVMAIVGGAGLSVAGVMMQGITRNPLVSPFTVGLSPAAAFGAALAILFGALQLPHVGTYMIVGGAFASSLICAGIVLGIAGFSGISATTIILAGIGLTYLFSAFTATLQFVATQEQLAAIVHWTFGSLNAAGWEEVGFSAVMLAIAAPVFWRMAWALNAMAAGEETAASLGYDLKSIRLVTALLSVLVTACIIAFTGVIGFIGLVSPHIARMLIGNDHRWLVPFSMIVGAVLLLVADTIGRSLFSPAVIPVGIVVAYVGVPLFVHLILRQRRRAMQ